MSRLFSGAYNKFKENLIIELLEFFGLRLGGVLACVFGHSSLSSNSLPGVDRWLLFMSS